MSNHASVISDGKWATLDLNDPEDAHIDERLSSEYIIWLSATRPDGHPYLNLLWYTWDGSGVTFFYTNKDHELLHQSLAHNAHVMMALEALNLGEDVVRFEGVARLLSPEEMRVSYTSYAEKYSMFMQAVGWDAEERFAACQLGVRVQPTRFLQPPAKQVFHTLIDAEH
jgi:PPOX class probable F420-dependent enzyme